MIVLDTNVLSEVLRPASEARVLQWLANESRAALFTTTVTRVKVFYGIRLLPAGARRQSLWDATQIIFDEEFAGRVLTFDDDAADAYADIASSRRSQGKPISQFDAMIAAVVRSRGATLATRNVKEFIDCGIEIIAIPGPPEGAQTQCLRSRRSSLRIRLHDPLMLWIVLEVPRPPVSRHHVQIVVSYP